MKKKVFSLILVLSLVLLSNLAFSISFSALEPEIHFAARRGDMATVRTLIQKRVYVDSRNVHGDTPLMFASMYGHEDIAIFLIAKRAKINAKDNQFGWTALMWASGQGHKDIVELLIANGADVNARDKKGFTALVVASNKGRKEIIALLRKHGATE